MINQREIDALLDLETRRSAMYGLNKQPAIPFCQYHLWMLHSMYNLKQKVHGTSCDNDGSIHDSVWLMIEKFIDSRESRANVESCALQWQLLFDQAKTFCELKLAQNRNEVLEDSLRVPAINGSTTDPGVMGFSTSSISNQTSPFHICARSIRQRANLAKSHSDNENVPYSFLLNWTSRRVQRIRSIIDELLASPCRNFGSNSSDGIMSKDKTVTKDSCPSPHELLQLPLAAHLHYKFATSNDLAVFRRHLIMHVPSQTGSKQSAAFKINPNCMVVSGSNALGQEEISMDFQHNNLVRPTTEVVGLLQTKLLLWQLLLHDLQLSGIRE
jgi:hypothetical protein